MQSIKTTSYFSLCKLSIEGIKINDYVNRISFANRTSNEHRIIPLMLSVDEKSRDNEDV